LKERENLVHELLGKVFGSPHCCFSIWVASWAWRKVFPVQPQLQLEDEGTKPLKIEYPQTPEQWSLRRCQYGNFWRELGTANQ